jgi:hypothetical protein
VTDEEAQEDQRTVISMNTGATTADQLVNAYQEALAKGQEAYEDGWEQRILVWPRSRRTPAPRARRWS